MQRDALPDDIPEALFRAWFPTWQELTPERRSALRRAARVARTIALAVQAAQHIHYLPQSAPLSWRPWQTSPAKVIGGVTQQEAVGDGTEVVLGQAARDRDALAYSRDL